MYASELEQKYNVWLANYTSKTGYAGQYQYWQYSSGGYINGITSGKVDCNFYYTTDAGYQNIKIEHQSAQPGATDADILVNVQNPGGGIVSEIGFTLYDQYGNAIGTYRDTCGFSSSRVAYSAKLSDYQVQLTPRTAYSYLPYAKVGYTTYTGTRQTFTTTEPHVESSQSVSVSKDNAVVTATLDNPAGTLVEQVGIELYHESGYRLGSYYQYCYTTDQKPVFEFDIAQKTGVRLEPNTKYGYEIHYVYDGRSERSYRQSFTTSANDSVDTLYLMPESLTLSAAAPKSNLVALWYPQDAQVKPKWTSSNPNVASVDASGNVAAVGKGTAVITVTLLAEKPRPVL